MWTTNPRVRDFYGVRWVKGYPGAGICEQDDGIQCGATSGEAAIGLARYFGASRAVLLGYDCKRAIDARGATLTHWHVDHPKKLGNGGDMDFWNESMTKLARQAGAKRFEVINASRDTALECWPRMDLEDALR